MLITEVGPGTPAADHGLKAGDVIVEVQQEDVTSPADVQDRVEKVRKAGRGSVLFLVQSSDGPALGAAVAEAGHRAAAGLTLSPGASRHPLPQAGEGKDALLGLLLPLPLAGEGRGEGAQPPPYNSSGATIGAAISFHCPPRAVRKKQSRRPVWQATPC